MIFWTQSTNSLNFALTFTSQETTKSHDNYIISRKLAGQVSNVHSVELTGFTVVWKMILINASLINWSDIFLTVSHLLTNTFPKTKHKM